MVAFYDMFQAAAGCFVAGDLAAYCWHNYHYNEKGWDTFTPVVIMLYA